MRDIYAEQPRVKYVSIGMWEDYDADDYMEILQAETRGCGCCSERHPLTEERLEEHIESLEAALADAKSILKEHFGEDD